MCRLRQIVEDITKRRKRQTVADRLVVEWQTRQIAWFIGSSVVGVKNNKLPGLAQKIKLVPQDDRDDVKVRETDPSDDPDVYVEQGSQVAADRNRAGSMESLLRGLREVPGGG